MDLKHDGKKVDQLSKKKESSVSTIHEDLVQDLNEYFITLFVDDHYVEHVSVDIKEESCATSMSSAQVFNTLSNMKKTATGANALPFWVWTENAVVLIPVTKIIWD